jgi:hypothetical protein
MSIPTHQPPGFQAAREVPAAEEALLLRYHQHPCSQRRRSPHVQPEERKYMQLCTR